jgi:5-methylthioadenosine/S-adenosylhomocysteine deaminase
MENKKTLKRFYGGKILLTEGKSFKVIDGEVVIDGDKIISVSETPLYENKGCEEFDLKGNLLMPSFKNAHTHSAMTFLRSFADDLPLQEWLFTRIFPMEDKLCGEHIYTYAKLAGLEYLQSGITSSFDMYFFLDDYVKANIDMGFKTVMCGSVNGDPKRAEELVSNFEKYNGKSDLIKYVLGFHAEYTATEALLDRIGEVAKALKAPVFTHNSETQSEVDECIKKYGVTPTQLFASKGIYDFGGGGFHCVYLSDEDMEIFKEKGLWAVTCPASNAKLASGIADLSKQLDRGLNMAIGTDGPASNNALDMFREMYLACALQKLKYMSAAQFGAENALWMATAGSALAMGLDDCDCIAVGKKADLIVIDMNTPNMQPVHDVAKNLVYSGSKQNVKMTMINGKILYKDGVFHIDEKAEDIYARANTMLAHFKD